MFEILFLAGLALIVIGPKELPQVARTIGRFLNDLKRATGGVAEELKQQARIDFNETQKKDQNSQTSELPADKNKLDVKNKNS